MTHFLDNPVLNTLPGSLIIDSPVPEAYRTEDNPDGETPCMTAHVTADTLRIALEGLHTMDNADLLHSMIVYAAFHEVQELPIPNDGMYPQLYRAILNQDYHQVETPGTAACQQFQEFLSQYTDWLDFSSEIELFTESGARHIVSVQVNAPGYVAAQHMLENATHEETVREIAERYQD